MSTSVESRINNLETWQYRTDKKIKRLEDAEIEREKEDIIRDWVYSVGRYFLPLGLALATFLLGKYG